MLKRSSKIMRNARMILAKKAVAQNVLRIRRIKIVHLNDVQRVYLSKRVRRRCCIMHNAHTIRAIKQAERNVLRIKLIEIAPRAGASMIKTLIAHVGTKIKKGAPPRGPFLWDGCFLCNICYDKQSYFN